MPGPIQILSARIEMDDSVNTGLLDEDIPVAGDRRVLVLEYRLPNEMVPHTDPEMAKQGKSMNDDPLYGGHFQNIPWAALLTRQAMYGHPSTYEALEECIYESVGRFWRNDPNKIPTHAQRTEARGRTPITGLRAALRKAGITIDDFPDDHIARQEQHHLVRFGREVVAAARGVDPATLPDPRMWHPRMGRLVKERLPKVKPPQANTPS